MSIEITFLPDRVMIEAEAGESVLEAARRAGVEIPTGCLRGSCQACEVEIQGLEDLEDLDNLGNLDNLEAETVCACITSVPLGKNKITVTLYRDPTW
ncbi:MAG: 2Fe-2S iron-sulfur cluster binding domain-containing protein [Coleofasciculaceae cyanobacterium SM2_1_6]|nr:2Fe-2S iron-sulfur cluster binding domain-containing protein [Coleofasciculaceae cyanobacterium SM2_1_6]